MELHRQPWESSPGSRHRKYKGPGVGMGCQPSGLEQGNEEEEETDRGLVVPGHAKDSELSFKCSEKCLKDREWGTCDLPTLLTWSGWVFKSVRPTRYPHTCPSLAWS